MNRLIKITAFFGLILSAMILVSCTSEELMISNVSAGLSGGFEITKEG